MGCLLLRRFGYPWLRQAETHGAAGKIIADNALYESTEAWIIANPVDDYWRVQLIKDALPLSRTR
jgi:hypothetical protein